MFANASKRLMECDACWRLAVSAMSFMLIWITTTLSTHAAGCGHHTANAAEDLPPGLTRIYENGRFYYYKIVPPCSGASCGRSDSSSLASVPVAISSERIQQVVCDAPRGFVDIPRRPVRSSEVQSNYSSPAFDEPLRPPV
ncbi:MAG: hypothetical protein SFV81_11595 [Pirellulaceae bacterium]|nr:hypothetical protein [Pirellulaceae bacterium]